MCRLFVRWYTPVMSEGGKIRVGILFGGQSAEHEVSLQSAKNVADAIDRSKYDVTLVKIGKDGRWERPVIDMAAEVRCAEFDVVFPILHGPFGEDGTVQGLLRLAGVPFVGSGVLGSAVGMDKDVMKRLLREAGLPIGKFRSFKKSGKDEKLDFDAVVAELGLPLFVKPANMGSSVGVSKAKDRESFEAAAQEAFRYDSKVLVEEFIEGRELECAVLGNDAPIASCVGEILPHHEFYSYDAKYIDPDGAGLEIPARVSQETTARIQELAIKTFKTLCCEGLGRVDVFLKKDGAILVNEINTMPGFTAISMYPQLWAASGISYPTLIDPLIELALEKGRQ